MNITTQNALSFLSGAETATTLPGQTLSLSDRASGFSASLMSQLSALQNSIASGQTPDIAAMQSLVALSKAEGLPQSPAFAAWLNQRLPASAAPEQDADLDAAMQELADMLQSMPMADSTSLPVEKSASENAETTIDLPIVAQQTLTAIPPQPITQAPVQTDGEQTVETPEETGMPLPAPTFTPALRSPIAPANATAQPSSRLGELDGEFERGFAAMLAGNESDNATSINKGILDISRDDLAQANVETDSLKTSSEELNRSVVGDVARMNQSLRGRATSDATAISRPLNDPAWNKELGEKLIWMHKQAVPSAELRLNPEHLGPISIRVDVQGDQANIAFTTHHLAVKEAIEAALPKLREMLQGQQLNLADVNVSQQNSDPRQGRAFFQMGADQDRREFTPSDDAINAVANPSQDIIDEIESGRAIASNGLLSLYA